MNTPDPPSLGIPLLDSKLHVPRLRRGVVRRPRLDERLNPGDLPALVLVSAPAGFGKTTLLAEWLTARNSKVERVAWLSLDRRDSDPTLFWAYVVSAVRKAATNVGTEAVSTLQSTPTALESVVTSVVNDLEALADDVVLVLDDYHVVESFDVHDSMRFFIDHLPERLRLVVASRADPPWPLARLRARGELLEIRASDLRFTAQEAAAYLGDAMGLDLSVEDVDALETRTEGWIAALQLAALSLQGRDDPSAFIASFAGDDRFVVDYLADEVLDRQSDDIRAFLLETSILSRLSADLCAAVTGRSDAKAILDTLERSNLFLVALDDRRRWYRYHHLFGDVLRARLTDEHPDRIADLHHRAGDWFEADGDRPEALRHALAAGDHDKAAELVELGIPDLRRARQDATQQEWLDALPEEVFTNRPVLNVARVGARMVVGDTAGVEKLLNDVEAWLEPDRPKDELVVHHHAEFARLPTQVAMYRAGLALLHGDLAGTIAHGERAANLSAPDDHLGRGAAAALIGLARWAEGDLASAARQYAAAIEEFHDAKYYADILGCSLGLADMQVGQGQLGAAEQTLSAGLDLAATHGPLRGTADMHIGLAEIHLERNELDAAAEHLRASLDLGDRLALAQHPYRWRVADARLHAIDGDHEGALRLLHDAARLYDTDYSPKARPVTAAAARAQIAAGNLAAAQQWAIDAGVSVDDETSYLREYEHLTLARLLLASGDARQAEPLLERLLEAAEQGGRDGSAVEATMLLALAQSANGDTARALVTLAEALTRAEPERLVRVFLDAGTPMLTLLEAAVAHGRASTQATALLGTARRQAPRAPAQGLVEELSARELDVLRLLRSELSGPEIAAELVVSLNTVRTHTKNIFTKLGVNSRRAAVRWADELGL
ncbi:MAG: LuxR C-terminal-related transcriptional regulator [Actinomycetota bacterium]|nr:LuxR C-terminal-related transcriptional regulator [Actinomycetota bacterium]